MDKAKQVREEKGTVAMVLILVTILVLSLIVLAGLIKVIGNVYEKELDEEAVMKSFDTNLSQNLPEVKIKATSSNKKL